MTQRLPQRSTQRIGPRISQKISQKIPQKVNQVDLSRFTTIELNMLLSDVLVKLRHRETRRAAQGHAHKAHETIEEKIAKHISGRRT